MKTLPKLQPQMTVTLERDGRLIRQEYFLVETDVTALKESLENKLSTIEAEA